LQRRNSDFFNCGVLGILKLTQRYSRSAAFVFSRAVIIIILDSITWESRDGSPRPKGAPTWLYHFAILYPTRAALALPGRRLMPGDISS